MEREREQKKKREGVVRRLRRLSTEEKSEERWEEREKKREKDDHKPGLSSEQTPGENKRHFPLSSPAQTASFIESRAPDCPPVQGCVSPWGLRSERDAPSFLRARRHKFAIKLRRGIDAVDKRAVPGRCRCKFLMRSSTFLGDLSLFHASPGEPER
ncbi:hypothetical protein CDAR_541151 [Caerostris darwini]|uniref:Uncharacterized protein n=1 Tax=Caerostris darwini TaxID=1538125 RepID=A0AAV4WAL3_9ARAC|nr:hypothetical protein CDAR_541151 [Caerostris darwini]